MTTDRPLFQILQPTGAIIGYRRDFRGRDGVALHVGARIAGGDFVPLERHVWISDSGLRALARELDTIADAIEGGRDGLE